MIITFIFGILIIVIALFLFCAIQVGKKANEMEEKYERKNKRMDKGSRNKSN